VTTEIKIIILVLIAVAAGALYLRNGRDGFRALWKKRK